MPRVAILADIHGNVPALQAVLEDLREQQVDEILIGGDLVGRGPDGSRVVQEVRSREWAAVRGNHEDYLLGFRRRQVPDDWLETDEWAAARFMAAELEEADVDYIDALPFQLQASLEPSLCLFHGSPRSHSEGLGIWTPDEILEGFLAEIEGDLLVCGHTHRPMLRRTGAGTVVNVGAVGLPFNRDRRAQYAIFSRGRDGWSIEFRQVDYDIEETLRAYESSGFRAQGGVTAELLRLELLHAAPFLVPFLKWTSVRGIAPGIAEIDPFLDFYDPSVPAREFFARLERLRMSGGSDPDAVP